MMLRHFVKVLSAVTIVAAVGCAATSDEDVESGESPVTISADKRQAAVAGARVWSEAEFAKLATKDVFRGQNFKNAPIPGTEIICKFIEPKEKGELGGKTEKFQCGPCELTPDEIAAGKKACNVEDTLKVKYSGIGRPATETNPARLAEWTLQDAKSNGEVFAEGVGTRLMWALGYYADGIYPVKVTCYGCPEKPWDTYRSYPTAAGGARLDRKFTFGAVEIKGDGKKIEATPDQGFDWKLDAPKIDPAKGGSSKDEVESWKLLAAFMFHGDNKAANQRLFCPKAALAEDGTCTEPKAMMQDVGASFGSEGAIFGLGYKKAELNAWKNEALWKDQRTCQANLQSVHELKHPVITESGRAFLARLMDKSVLTDEKVTAIFTASRIAERGEKIKGADGRERLVTVADWVAAFNKKREDLSRPCGR
jgi:hypothetical protein